MYLGCGQHGAAPARLNALRVWAVKSKGMNGKGKNATALLAACSSLPAAVRAAVSLLSSCSSESLLTPNLIVGALWAICLWALALHRIGI